MKRLKITQLVNNYNFLLSNNRRIKKIVPQLTFIRFPIPVQGRDVTNANFEWEIYTKSFNVIDYPNWMVQTQKTFPMTSLPKSRYAVVGHCILPAGWLLAGILATAESELGAYAWRRAVLNDAKAKAVVQVVPLTQDFRKELDLELRGLLLGARGQQEDKSCP